MNSQAQRLHKWRISTARLASLISLLLLSTSFSSPLWAVDCDPMSMLLQTQAEVDGFQETYGPCDRVLSLYLEGTDISNLDGLSALTDVASSLYIQNNPVLVDVDGLSALTTVTRNLWIQNNASLADLDGFSALTSVSALLAIFENDALTNINGLSALTVVGGSLVIRDNAILTDCCGCFGFCFFSLGFFFVLLDVINESLNIIVFFSDIIYFLLINYCRKNNYYKLHNHIAVYS